MQQGVEFFRVEPDIYIAPPNTFLGCLILDNKAVFRRAPGKFAGINGEAPLSASTPSFLFNASSTSSAGLNWK